MLGLGPHAGYIILSYGVAALVLAGLLLWALVTDHRARRDVRVLEDQRRARAKP
jgi:heme exporter protein D